jgi:hypothetical protein
VQGAQWLFQRVNSSAGLAFALGVAPGLIIVAGNFQLYLPGLQFSFLYGKDIGVKMRENIVKAFFYASPKAVHVP